MAGPHVIGFAGDPPSDLVPRAERALHALGLESSAVYESSRLVAAFGPASSCVVAEEGTSCAVLAGPLFVDEGRGSGTLAQDQAADARALARGLRRWGDEAPLHLRFEGSLLAWNGETSSGYVARDHLGYGSLYWTTVGGGVVFATEVRLLLDVLSTRPSPDDAAIALWLGGDATRPDLSFYEGVRQLAPGHRLLLGEHGIRVDAYWQPVYVAPPDWTMEDAAEELRPLVLRAVGRRLPREGRTGVLMSGGVDSGAVAGFARALREDVTVYSNVFPGDRVLDESPWIDELVDFLGVESVRAVIEPQGVLLSLVEFVRTWSVPPDGSGYWWTPLYRQPAIDGVSTLFTGDGGDEVFHVRRALIADMLRQGRVLKASSLARRAPYRWFYPPPRLFALDLWEAGVSLAFPSVARGVRMLHAARGADVPRWFSRRLVRPVRDAVDEEGWRRLSGPRWWAEGAYDLVTRIPGLGMVPLNRRYGEASGIRMCSPLFDVDVLEAALRCPPELGFSGGLTKPLLRAVASGFIPENVRLRPGKTRFNSMFLDGIGGLEFLAIDRLLRDPEAEIGAYVDREVLVRDLLDGRPTLAEAGASERAFDLYRLAGLECWLRHERDRNFGEPEGVVGWAFEIHRSRPPARVSARAQEGSPAS